MQTITHIRKPATLINVAYFTTVLIGVLVTSLAYSINEGHAMTPAQNVLSCEKAFNDGFFQKIPKVTQKRCGLIFQKMTWEFGTGNYNPYTK